MKNNINKRALKWIYDNGKRCIPSTLLLTLMSVSTGLVSLKFTDVSKNVLDIATRQRDGSLKNACIWMVILLTVQLIIQISMTFVNVHASAKMDIEMKRNIFKKMINKDYIAVSKYHSGDLLTRLTSDL